ncbi:MAG TPA: ABC transporter ATP-binding protein [Casimicrobiaceae bacterium]|nr:ABC transporter ATP-binding protein [Casimicrobiaceae bacterium]
MSARVVSIPVAKSNVDAEAHAPHDVLLDIRDLRVDLPPGADRAHAVDGVSLALAREEILCVVGESGSCKSVMARAIMGLLPVPHVRVGAGEILFGGDDLTRLSEARLREVRGKDIAMIFQEPMTALNPVMTIGRQIGEVLAVHGGIVGRDARKRAAEIMAAVKLPDPGAMLDAYPHQLSGGQRQRAMIAMALILGPRVLIADEPTTALDVTTQAQILALIRDLQREKRTGVIFITHDFGVVAEIADRVAVMQRGRVVEAGRAEQVLSAPTHAYTRKLIAAVPNLTPRKARALAGAPVVLALRGVEKTYRTRPGIFRAGGRTVHAVRDASLTLRRDETLGIVGESGSGKSTLARCVARIVEADGGEVLLDGVDLRRLSRRAMRVYHRRVQMVFQDPYGSLNPRQSVGNIIAEGPIVHGIARSEAWRRAAELIELVGLDGKALARYPHEFSGGQRQRIGIARALALQPEVLVADEPVSALDVSVQAQVLRLLADIRDRLHLSMLFITHDLRVAAQVCDTIAVMREGEIVEYGAAADVFGAPRHEYTRELFAAVPGRGWQHAATGTA